MCFFFPNFSPLPSLPLSFFLSCITSRSGNHKLQLQEAGGFYAPLCQCRSQLCDINVDQAAVRGVSARRLHHPGGHHWQEDVLHPARGGERPHQRQQGDQAGRWLLLWRCMSVNRHYTAIPTVIAHVLLSLSWVHWGSSTWNCFPRLLLLHPLFISTVWQLPGIGSGVMGSEWDSWAVQEYR